MLNFHKDGNLITGDMKVFSGMSEIMNIMEAEKERYCNDYCQRITPEEPGNEEHMAKVWAHLTFYNNIMTGSFNINKTELEEAFVKKWEDTESRFNTMTARLTAQKIFESTYTALLEKAVDCVYESVKDLFSGNENTPEDKLAWLKENGYVERGDIEIPHTIPHTSMPPDIVAMIDVCFAEKFPLYYGFGLHDDKPPFSKQHADIRGLPRRELNGILNMALHITAPHTLSEYEYRNRIVETNLLRLFDRENHKKAARELGLLVERFDDSIRREKEVAEAITETPKNNHGEFITTVTRLHVWGGELKKYLIERGIYEDEKALTAEPAKLRSKDLAAEWRKRYVFNLSDDFRVEIMPVYEGDTSVNVSFYRPVFKGEEKNEAEHGGEVVIKAEWNLKKSKMTGGNLLKRLVDDLTSVNTQEDVKKLFPLTNFISPISREDVTQENKGAMSYSYHEEDQVNAEGKNVEPPFSFDVTNAMYAYPKQSNENFKAILREEVPEYDNYEEFRR